MFTVIIKYIFYIGLFVLAAIGSMVFRRRKNRAEEELASLKNYFQTVEATLNSVRYGNLAKKIDMDLYPDYSALTRTINRMIETLNDREQMLYESQTELRNQNKFLQASINSLSDGIAIIDHEGTIINASNNMYRWFDVDVIRGKNILEFINLLDDVNLFDLNNHEISIKSNVELSFLADCNKLELEDRKERYVLVLKNISDQKEIETLKEDFVATLTHDLKVPIIAESNMLDLLLSDKFGEISDKQRVALNNMKASNNELIDLVQTVLETYKVNSAGLSIYPELFDLNTFLTEIIEEMQPIALHTENKINLDINDEIFITADITHLRRVIKNLIHNAISYGSACTDIDIKAFQTDDKITITVKDYGKGISKDDIKKIFQKYYSTAKKFRKTGTGLGLFLSQQIIKAHNGTLEVQSEPDKYTEFCIIIPKQ